MLPQTNSVALDASCYGAETFEPLSKWGTAGPGESCFPGFHAGTGIAQDSLQENTKCVQQGGFAPAVILEVYDLCFGNGRLPSIGATPDAAARELY